MALPSTFVFLSVLLLADRSQLLLLSTSCESSTLRNCSRTRGRCGGGGWNWKSTGKFTRGNVKPRRRRKREIYYRRINEGKIMRAWNAEVWFKNALASSRFLLSKGIIGGNVNSLLIVASCFETALYFPNLLIFSGFSITRCGHVNCSYIIHRREI